MSTLVDINDLASLIPINSLNPDNLHELAKKTPVETIASGRYLFKKGDSDRQHIYLLGGNVELLNDKEKIKTISARQPEARQPLAHSQPRQFSARALEECTFIRVDSNLLDIMMTWDQTGTYQVEELEGGGGESDDDWMTQLLQTSAFHKVPPANIQAIFMRMEPVQYNPGDVVITQGEDGDYFYIIKSGRAMVTRSTPTNPKGVKLADLGPGDSFGEEALISESKRNATITMLTKGTMVRLAKKDFNSLLNEPIQNWIDYQEAANRIAKGAIWLDVRLPSEFKLGHIKGATNQPLISLRLKLKTLNQNVEYILYCDTGRRSSAAAFLLSEAGFNCEVLKDGMAGVPETDKETESAS